MAPHQFSDDLNDVVRKTGVWAVASKTGMRDHAEGGE